MTGRRLALPVLVPALLLAATVALAGCGSSGSESSGSSGSSSASPKKGTCSYKTDTLGEVPKKVDKPPAEPAYKGEVKATITTTFGAIPLVLDADSAPCAVNSFLSLAAQKFYDGSPCNRVVSQTGTVGILQCGDPTGTGTGGPGYAFGEEVTGQERYSLGVIAMAKRNTPGSTGSQFFMMFADSSQAFPPDYTILGKVADAAGLAVLQKAGAAAVRGKGEAYDGPTATPVVLTTVRAG